MDRTETIEGGENGGIPNHPRWPALIERGACHGGEAALRDRFATNGWGGLWAWSVFDYHHFHPASHEVLGVAKGTANLHLGGPDGPVIEVTEGDVLILPAGFGHKRVSASRDFRVVGAYPPGQEKPEVLRAYDVALQGVIERLLTLPCPDADPAYGKDGPMRKAWI